MRITELMDKRSIEIGGRPKDKKEALDQMIALMLKSGKIKDEEAYRRQVYAREEEGTTGIGEGIAIPHGRCDAVEKPGLAAMVVKGGVDFDALDGEPVTLIFLIAAPNTKDNVHLDMLSKLSVMMMDEEFQAALRNAGTPEEFLEIIDKADAETASIDERLADTGTADDSQVKILAATSCPTGIAHTYMAAEGIEKAAKEKNCYVKIETRGSGGAKNVLTAKDIEEADCIIVAADAQVPMERFDGKKVIECQVSDGISKAGELLERAISGNAPVYHSASKTSASPQAAKKSGIEVRTGVKVASIDGETHVNGVTLSDGEQIKAGMVIISAGVRANTELAKKIGLITKRGVVVDSRMQSSQKDIYACGDCAEFQGISYGVWPEAVEEGKVAGANAAGEEVEYTAKEPALTFHGMNTALFAAGDNGKNPNLLYKTIVYQDMGREQYQKYYFLNDRLCGVILLGDLSLMGRMSELLKRHASCSEVLNG